MPPTQRQGNLAIPTDDHRSQRHSGCGCCSKCQCTGACADVERSDGGQLGASYNRSPGRSHIPSRAPSPMPVTSLPTVTIEQVPHPADLVAFGGSKHGKAQNHLQSNYQSSTPVIASRRDHSRKNSRSEGRSATQPTSPTDGSRPNVSRSNSQSRAVELQRRPSRNDGELSPEAAPALNRRNQTQDEYEKGYASRSHRKYQRREDTDITVTKSKEQSDDEIREEEPARVRRDNSRRAKQEAEPVIRREHRRKNSTMQRQDKMPSGESGHQGTRRKDRNLSRKEKVLDEVDRTEDESGRQRLEPQRSRRSSPDTRYQSDDEEVDMRRRGRKGDDDRGERENRARSKSRPREPVAEKEIVSPPLEPVESRGSGLVDAADRPPPVTSSRSEAVAEVADYVRTKISSKRELIKELIKSSIAIPANAPVLPSQNLGRPTNTNGPTTSPYNTGSPVDYVEVLKPVETRKIDETRFGSFNAVKKLTVRLSPDHGLMLHFLDWAQRNEINEPLVAFRLEDGEQGPFEMKKTGIFSKNNKADWLHESHETGAKVRARVRLGVGIRGPLLFNIDVRKRRVDKFTVTGLPDQYPDFRDDPHHGNHDDYRHLYFEAPDGRTLKWHLAEPGRLMRLYGRGENDYGVLYAEAKISKADSRKHRGPKDVQIFFYDPKHPDQPVVNRQDGSPASPIDSEVDYAFLCASWWCARQTFEEARLMEAHDEVELIENIQKTFEVDLLAGA